MEIKDLGKIILISDTHYRLSQAAYDALESNYDPDQIYESQIFTNDEQIINDYSKIKNELNKKPADLIVHAGDVGSQEIIDIIESIAPLTAINGNCDFQTYRTFNGETKDFEYFDFNGLKIALTHNPYDLDSYIEGGFFRKNSLPANAPKPKLKIHGHTHKAEIVDEGDEIIVCPGSATMGRYGTPNSIAVIYVYNSEVLSAELIRV